MKIFQIIIVCSFFRLEGSLEKGSPVIDVKNFNSFQEARTHVIEHINKLQNKTKTEMDADAKQEYLRADTVLKNGIITYKMNVVEKEDTNPLDEFCINEAKFRLTDIFGIPEKDISEDLLEDTAKSIRHTIDYCEVLYDQMDDEIREIIESTERGKNE